METILFGLSPNSISKIATKAYQFWDQQNMNQYKIHSRQQSQKIKELENKLKNQALKNQKQINELNQEVTKYKGFTKAIKAKYQKLMGYTQKLQKDFKDKQRQYVLVNNRYSALLKKQRNKENSNNPSLPNSHRSPRRTPLSSIPRSTTSDFKMATMNNGPATDTVDLTVNSNTNYHHHRRLPGNQNTSTSNFVVKQYHPYSQQNKNQNRNQIGSIISSSNPVKFSLCFKFLFFAQKYIKKQKK